MFNRHANPHKIPSDSAAFAAAAAAAQADATHQMSSTDHHHLSSATAAATSQFGLTVPLSSDPAHNSLSAAPQSQNHLFDRSDHHHHSLSLAQSAPLFTSHHQPSHHHPSHIHTANTHHPTRRHQLPSAPHALSQSLPQQIHQQPPRKNKRTTPSAPPPPPPSALPRPHRPSSLSIPPEHSQQQHTVNMVGQDPHPFSRLGAPPSVNVAQSPDNPHGSPLRNDSLYPHLTTTRTTHQHQHQHQHHSHQHPEHHIAIQPQSNPQQHPGLRTVPASFTANQLSEPRIPAASRIPFEEESRRRAPNPQPAPQQNNTVMLQFPDNYIAQQHDGINDTRHRVLNMSEPVGNPQRDVHPRFDADPATLVNSGMPYDIKEGDLEQKRIGTNGTPTGEGGGLTSGPLDPAAMSRQPTLMAARAPTRVGPDGRPMNPSAFIHGTIEKRVACENCGQLFGDLGSLKRHAARSHRAATGKGPVYCPQCNASLKNEQNLRRHVAVCHSGDQENRCDMCNASFSSRGSLRIHQQQVHNVPPGAKNGRSGRGGRGGARGGRVGGINKSSKSDKSYVCDMCTDTFKWKGNLKRHRELRHLQLRPFNCQICNASFGTKSNMRVHLITHNGTQNK